MPKPKDGEQANKAGPTHAGVAIWRTAEKLGNPERTGRKRAHRALFRVGVCSGWRKVWSTKKVRITFTCLSRLLPGIISLLLISQVFSQALTVWGSPNAWDVTRPCSTSEEMSQRSRPLRGHVSGSCSVCLSAEGQVTKCLMSGMPLNFADTELKLCSLRPSQPRETDLHWRTAHEPYVKTIGLPWEWKGTC